jgi:hypothetical protein
MLGEYDSVTLIDYVEIFEKSEMGELALNTLDKIADELDKISEKKHLH